MVTFTVPTPTDTVSLPANPIPDSWADFPVWSNFLRLMLRALGLEAYIDPVPQYGAQNETDDRRARVVRIRLCAVDAELVTEGGVKLSFHPRQMFERLGLMHRVRHGEQLQLVPWNVQR